MVVIAALLCSILAILLFGKRRDQPPSVATPQAKPGPEAVQRSWIEYRRRMEAR